MSYPSPLVPETEGRLGDRDGAIVFNILKFAWPAILLFGGLTVMVGVQIAVRTQADVYGIAPGALSQAALDEGRWWTLASHILFHADNLSQLATFALCFLAILSVIYARDQAWMGGWRMPAVYAACAFDGGLAHILSGTNGAFTGVWSGFAGLLAYYLASGRLPGTAKQEKSAPIEERLGLSLLFPWCLVVFSLEEHGPHLPFAPSLPAKLIVLAVGVIVIVACLRAKRRWLSMLLLTPIILLLTVSYTVWIVQGLQTLAIGWEALITGAMTGLVLGRFGHPDPDRPDSAGRAETA